MAALLTLVVASYQAFMFTFSSIALINIHAVTWSVLIKQILIITLFSSILGGIYVFAHERVFIIALFIGFGLYALQLVYCVRLFYKEYADYKLLLDNFFSYGEERRLRWVKQVFLIALFTGFFAIASLFFGNVVYLSFVVSYTLLYVYFAMKYINYVHDFRYLIPVIQHSERVKTSVPIHDNSIVKKLDTWIESEGYVAHGITLEMLSKELDVNNAQLGREINIRSGLTFRAWISHLRVEKSKQLLVGQPHLPILTVGEKAGFGSKGSFFRQFMQTVGETPMAYRKRIINK
ncbi:helix-turn-helix domain-containing protein [Bacteroides sp. 214]|uniref:AraC family transcriptional regulator n=1 Tax=Bacteroides sp. 214 TaxID=2302935 RepID=UPI0013D255D7